LYTNSISKKNNNPSIHQSINKKMSLPQIAMLSGIEIVGDFAFKEFANRGGIVPLIIGIVGYIGVIISLVISLQNSSVLMVNAGWDGISGILESIVAYVYLGERLSSEWQYLGIVLIASGLYLLKIPMKKNKPFTIPKLF